MKQQHGPKTFSIVIDPAESRETNQGRINSAVTGSLDMYTRHFEVESSSAILVYGDDASMVGAIKPKAGLEEEDARLQVLVHAGTMALYSVLSGAMSLGGAQAAGAFGSMLKDVIDKYIQEDGYGVAQTVDPGIIASMPKDPKEAS